MKIKKIKILVLCSILLAILMPTVFADINPDAYQQIYQNGGGDNSIKEMGGNILAVVQAVGTAVAVIMLAIIAIRYFISSPDQKADLKSQLIPFVIGAILLFGASNLTGLVVRAVRQMFA